MPTTEQKKIAQLVIARLDGRDIDKRFKYYHSLVKKGIGGFIIFGGRLAQVRSGVKKLQKSAEIPLFIASDLEQGLGQQVEGGTLFPPAMAVGQAIDPDNRNDVQLLRQSVRIIAQEARSAGINIIFSPVLDVNTNSKNPIICTRSFSDDPKEVAWFGNEFIKGFHRQGVIACAKHFPGHGDTAQDSHLELPVIKAGRQRLYNIELYPFDKAIKAGVKMIMVGHLKVPVFDSKLPSSLSQKIIQGILKKRMKFKGLVITDAMNMRSVSKKSERHACLMALEAGADILLHPGRPEKVIDYLFSRWEAIEPEVEESFKKIIRLKKTLNKVHSKGSKSHRETAEKLTKKSVKTGNKLKKFEESPSVLILDDDNSKAGATFIKEIRKQYPEIKSFYVDNRYWGSTKKLLGSVSDKPLIILIFSKISAWKGRSGISRKLESVLKKTLGAAGYSVIAGFCCPYVMKGLRADVIIEAYSGSDQAQEAVAKILRNT